MPASLLFPNFCIWSLAVATSYAMCDQPVPPTRQLQILLVADTSAQDIGQSVQRDLDELWRVFSWIQRGREQRIQIDVIQGERVTPENILSYYHSRRGQLRDVSLLFFYSGHGGLDPVDGPFLALQQGRLPRVSLTTAMENTEASLAVILTNCCSNLPGVTPPKKDTGRTPAWEAFQQLFFQHRGLVDMTAAEDGTFAWGNLFCESFTDLICDPLERSDTNGDQFVGWNEFAPRLQDATGTAFQDLKRYLDQNQIERNYPHDLRDFSSQSPQINLTGYWRASQAATYWHVRASAWERAAEPMMKTAHLLLNSRFDQYSLQSRTAILRKNALRVSRCYSNAVNCELKAMQCLAYGSPDGVDQAYCESKLAHYRYQLNAWACISQRK